MIYMDLHNDDMDLYLFIFIYMDLYGFIWIYIMSTPAETKPWFIKLIRGVLLQ